MLPPETVHKLVSVLGLEDNAFVVGGQAFNLWAERYASADQELREFGPFTSKDLDYFGYAQAAAKLAKALQGKLNLPSPEDHTPSAAQVEVEINGLWIEIDFITNVIGVRRDLETFAVELLLPYRVEGASGVLAVPVMHPLHCFQSRVANVVRLGRSDDTAMRQLYAAPIVLGHYIDEALGEGDVKEVQLVLQRLADFLGKDPDGRRAHDLCRMDPLTLIDKAAQDERLDRRFRTFNLAGLALKIRAGRLLRQTFAAKREATQAAPVARSPNLSTQPIPGCFHPSRTEGQRDDP